MEFIFEKRTHPGHMLVHVNFFYIFKVVCLIWGQAYFSLWKFKRAYNFSINKSYDEEEGVLSTRGHVVALVQMSIGSWLAMNAIASFDAPHARI